MTLEGNLLKPLKNTRFRLQWPDKQRWLIFITHSRI